VRAGVIGYTGGVPEEDSAMRVLVLAILASANVL